MNSIRSILVSIAFLLVGSAAWAQTGGLLVQVVDDQGPLPQARVTISHATGSIKTTTEVTDNDGIVEFPVLRPGGGYVIEVAFPGFGTRRVSDLRVKINEQQTVTVQMAAEVQERVKVTAEGSVVDLEDTTTATKFSDEFIQDLPVPGRFYQNVLTLAPGVQDTDGDGNPNVHGSRDRDFKAVVSGISNVDPLTGQWMSRVNPNSIEEMEVITAGAGVEFSRAQGGFARILQKQGSNEFEGVMEFYYRSSLFDGTGAADFSNGSEPDFDWTQPSVSVSGPIVKDKLWYRLSHEWFNIDNPINTGEGIVNETTRAGAHSDQITWQASPRNKLALQFQTDPLKQANLGVSSTTPPESALGYERTGETYSLTWTAPYSPKILMESQVAWQDLNVRQFPNQAGVPNSCLTGVGSELSFLSDSFCRNLTTGLASGSWFVDTSDNRQRLTTRVDGTIYGGRFWGMNHQFKIGFASENERYFRELSRGPSTFLFIFDQNSGSGGGGAGETNPDPLAILPVTLAIPQDSSLTATSNNWGLYFQDQMKPLQNLTMTLGLRLDREELRSNSKSLMYPDREFASFLNAVSPVSEGGQGISTDIALQQEFTAYEDLLDFQAQLAELLDVSSNEVISLFGTAAQLNSFAQQTRRPDNLNITNTNFSPRLSVAWDPWSNGKTKFAFSAGRYYDKIFLQVPLIELEPITARVVYQADVAPDDSFTNPQLRSSINAGAIANAVDPNIKTPYSDEFTLNFERELFAETSISVTYVRKAYRDQLQDKDYNAAPGDYGQCRVPSIASPTPRVVASPGSGQMLVDPYTGVEYMDTDPGIGDGYVTTGFQLPFDDCAGERFVPEGQMIDPDEFGANETSLERPDGFADLYTQNPLWGNYYVVSNLNKIDYDGIVLELTRRQYRSWEMQASYTYSQAKGDGEDFDQGIDDDQSLIIDTQGYQSYDQRHVVKLNATTITPWGFRLGSAVTWQSGTPYSCLLGDFSYNQTHPSLQGLPGIDPNQVRFQYCNSERNTERNDSYWNVDLKFTKEMNLGRGLNMQVSAEVFNLLNDGTFIVPQGGATVNGNIGGFYRFGRRWQLGLKLAF